MIELYLNGERVYTDTSQTIKITKENPYFTQSGSYTLDITIPMAILENRLFFQNIQLLQSSKKTTMMSASLVVDNYLLLSGTAVVNSISDKQIKVQLLGGNSDINFIAKNGDVYIDDIDFGKIKVYEGTPYSFIGNRGGEPFPSYTYIYGEWDAWNKSAMGDVSDYVLMPVYDETNAIIKNETKVHLDANETRPSIYTHGDTIMPNLMMVIRKVIEHFGYNLVINDVDVLPWNRIVICNARKTLIVQEALPHWTVTDFLKEVQNFFNCTFVFNETSKTAELISNLKYFNKGEQFFEPLDEYSSDVSDDDEEQAQSLGSSNIKFDLSDSAEHLYDALSDEVLQGYERKEYGSFDELQREFDSMNESDRKKYIFVCPEGFYIYRTDGDPEDSSESSNVIWYLGQVNQFGAIIRNPKIDDYISLKICPVGITVNQMAGYYVDASVTGSTGHGTPWEKLWETEVQMPSLKNEKGDDPTRDYSKVVWSGIIGTQDLEEGTEPEDRMQVMFVGTELQYINKPGYSDQSKKIPYPMGFTDYKDKAIDLSDCSYQNTHDSWSLALSNSSAEHFLGQLHMNNYVINTQTEIQIQFESSFIPDIRKVFMFKNRRFVCEKLEISVGEKGLDKLIKGYFFEML